MAGVKMLEEIDKVKVKELQSQSEAQSRTEEDRREDKCMKAML